VNSKNDQQPITPVRGYLEGYYGKLLSWSERNDLLKFIASKRLNTYCYAPKEDASHRLHWRESYSSEWRKSFTQFCESAKNSNVSIIAGIAPGLDFDFDRRNSNNDFKSLQKKASCFLEDGANNILILWDDIEESGFTDCGGLSEGTAHAQIVNQLSEKLGQPLWTVPRVYASEIENSNNYLEDFFTELQTQHTVLLCGNTIVARTVNPADLARLSRIRNNNTAKTNGNGNNKEKTYASSSSTKHRTIVWDNFYANDYCPRRLFVGPWTGREHIEEYLLNPTGLPFTDRLLIDIAVSTHTSADRNNDWLLALKRHGVPDAFQMLAPYFSKPCFSDNGDGKSDADKIGETEVITPTNETEQAIEECLWNWKSPLAREWYPFIFGLKHDLALMQGKLPTDRILKTQTPALAMRLLG